MPFGISCWRARESRNQKLIKLEPRLLDLFIKMVWFLEQILALPKAPLSVIRIVRKFTLSQKIFGVAGLELQQILKIQQVFSSELELHRLATGAEPRVITALTRLKQRLFQYQGHVSAALVLGGVDVTGAHLFTVYPHGSTDRLPYATMGSGSLAAMAEFEKSYKDGLEEKEAIALVNNAVQAGIWNDLGSGGNVDICIIHKTKGQTMLRNYRTPNARKYRRQAGYVFPKGTTEWLKETEKILKHDIEVIPISAYEDEDDTTDKSKEEETTTSTSMDLS